MVTGATPAATSTKPLGRHPGVHSLCGKCAICGIGAIGAVCNSCDATFVRPENCAACAGSALNLSIRISSSHTTGASLSICLSPQTSSLHATRIICGTCAFLLNGPDSAACTSHSCSAISLLSTAPATCACCATGVACAACASCAACAACAACASCCKCSFCAVGLLMAHGCKQLVLRGYFTFCAISIASL